MTIADPTLSPGADRYFEDYRVGQRFVTGGRTLTNADIRLYMGATGTDHPNHCDEEYCRRHPVLEGVCAPGILTLGLLDAATTSSVSRFMAASMHYGHDKIRYLRPVYVGDTIHAEMEIVECADKDAGWGLVKMDQRAVNQRGEDVLYNLDVLIVQRRPAG
ncbi:MAG: MaoC family dehydratase [Actinobacteria bacterium]|nr:MaoC family dehydratase [Actinomycetota bacterium]